MRCPMRRGVFLLSLLLSAGLAPVTRPARAAAPPGGAGDWRTPAEVSDCRSTPRYIETMAYLTRLARAAPGRLRLETFGRTGEGRGLVAAVVSRDGSFDPEALRRAGRPVVLVQNAIHAGEMDGKDACLALLRDMVITRTREALVERAVLVVIPIYNADGHERFGPYNRVNQNGPESGGWRTQARNLNLNRDYMKADAPETRALLRLWNRWLPDLFVDDHVTDGADYQYDTTYGLDMGPDVPPALAAWNRDVLAPYLERSVGETGHVIGPYIALRDDADVAKGILLGQDLPRFSTGYAVLQNRPGLLVEMHMLKDYRTRVTGNYEVLRAVLELVNRDAAKLVAMNRAADAATAALGRTYDPAALAPLRLEAQAATEPFRFLGYRAVKRPSEISGAEMVEYTREPIAITVPRPAGLRVARSVTTPRAYIVPAAWTQVIEVLQAHGLRLLKTAAPWSGDVETYRCDSPHWFERPFEGRQVLFYPGEGLPKSGAALGPCTTVVETLWFPAGSTVVPLDQRAGRVALHFLEPEAPDSAVAWGFFNSVFEQKEFGEAYVLERLARDMMAKDPALKAEFERRLAEDKEIAGSPDARLNFFYRRSPFWDPRLGLYPVGRLTSLEGVPLAR
ncbi:MAG: peptidase M14 [Acidobacteria bacterium]|nr:MAG: peptidase M14 [Acidobacteriota bacterium]